MHFVLAKIFAVGSACSDRQISKILSGFPSVLGLSVKRYRYLLKKKLIMLNSLLRYTEIILWIDVHATSTNTKSNLPPPLSLPSPLYQDSTTTIRKAALFPLRKDLFILFKIVVVETPKWKRPYPYEDPRTWRRSAKTSLSSPTTTPTTS